MIVIGCLSLIFTPFDYRSYSFIVFLSQILRSPALEVLIIVRCANELLRKLVAILFGWSYKCSIWRRHVSFNYLCEIRWLWIVILFSNCETQMKLNIWLRGLLTQFQATYGKPLLAAKDAKCSSKDAEAGVLAMEALHKQVNLALLQKLCSNA